MVLRSPQSELFLGLVFGISILYLAVDFSDKTVPLDMIALGHENTNASGIVEGKKITCQDISDFDDCITDFSKTMPQQPVIMWLGNSQLVSINQIKAGDETAPVQLHRSMQKHNKYVISFSQPNANLQEHYLILAHNITRLPVETLILPIVFDDMRETDIRPGLLGLIDDYQTKLSLQKSKIGQILTKRYATDPAADPRAKTISSRLETLLNQELAKNWSIWRERSTLQGTFHHALYELRNWTFGITSRTERKIIHSHYRLNFLSLSALIDLASSKGIMTLAYIPPLRDDIKRPYNAIEYAAFKAEIRGLARQANIRLVDLEPLVPGHFWGTPPAAARDEVDFMHFQGKGHRLLADALYELLLDVNPNQ